LYDQGYRVEFLAGVGSFSLHHHDPDWLWGALSLVIKQPGHEADHLPPSSAEVKNFWSYTSTPQYIFMV
jgi:hypothetical protein